MCFQPGIFKFKSRIVAIGELHIMAVHQLLSRDRIGTISMNLLLVGSIVCLQKVGTFPEMSSKPSGGRTKRVLLGGGCWNCNLEGGAQEA